MERRNESEGWVKGLFITIIGGILIAWLIGEGSVFHGKSAIEMVGYLVKTAQAKRNQISITVENNLLVPVELYVDDTSVYVLGPEQNVLLSIPSESEKLSFISRSEFTPSDTIDGYFFSKVEKDNVYTIHNVLDKSTYFYIKLSNNLDYSCAVYIDKGYVNEKKIGIINPRQQDYFAGYFQLFSNSNVYLECPNNNYYWGIYNETGNKLMGVEENNGLLKLILNPN